MSGTDSYEFPTQSELDVFVELGLIAIGTTHKRKARTATALQFLDNEPEIAEFTHYATEMHNGWCYLRDPVQARLVGTIAPRAYAFYGEDGRLRILREEEFNSRYEVIL